MKTKRAAMLMILITITFFISACSLFNNTGEELTKINGNYTSLNDEGAFVTDDGFVFISEENYYWLPYELNRSVSEYSGITFRDNMLQIEAEIGVSKEVIEEIAREHDAEIIEFMSWDGVGGDWYTFRFERTFTFQELEDIAYTLMSLEEIYIAQIPQLIEVNPLQLNEDRRCIGNHPFFHDDNWGLRAISAYNAWEFRDLMSPVNVLVLDSGFYRTHEDLDFMVNMFDPTIDEVEGTHGTHVSGIIGALHNGIGINGTAPNSQMYAISTGAFIQESENYWDLVRTIDTYVRIFNVRVINRSMSWNLREFSASRGNSYGENWINDRARDFERLFLRLIADNYEFVFVDPTGNQNGNQSNIRFLASENDTFGFKSVYGNSNYWQQAERGIDGVYSPFARIQNPIARSRVITVGAVDGYRNLANFSQRGELLDVNAPGVDICSTYAVVNSESTYQRSSGTSMAAPFVSGLATMIFGINPDLTGEQVRQIIMATSVGENNIINAEEAVRTAFATRIDSGGWIGSMVGVNLLHYTGEFTRVESSNNEETRIALSFEDENTLAVTHIMDNEQDSFSKGTTGIPVSFNRDLGVGVGRLPDTANFDGEIFSVVLLENGDIELLFNDSNELNRLLGGVYSLNIDTNNIYNEVREAYMEFLVQRGFEQFRHNTLTDNEFMSYAIIDIDGDGIPELIINSRHGRFGGIVRLVFSYDVVQENVFFISYYTQDWEGTLWHSHQNSALVAEGTRGGSFELSTIDNLINEDLLFTLWARSAGMTGNDTMTFLIIEDGISRDISEAEFNQYMGELVEIEFLPIPLREQQSNLQNSENWQDWFSTSFTEWFGNNPPVAQGWRGSSLYPHPQDSESAIIFSIDPQNPTEYPIVIIMPINRFMNQASTSVAELERIYGSSFSATEYFDGWQGLVITEEYILSFPLANENDANITVVIISQNTGD